MMYLKTNYRKLKGKISELVSLPIEDDVELRLYEDGRVVMPEIEGHKILRTAREEYNLEQLIADSIELNAEVRTDVVAN